MNVVKKLHSSVICKYLDYNEPLHPTLFKTLHDGVGSVLPKEQDTTLQPFHKRSSQIVLEFLLAGSFLVRLACHNVLVKASLKEELEAIVELAEEKEQGMI